MEFSTPPLPMTHIVPTVGSGGSGTLRRGVRGLVPPPDVTHHTNHSKSTHDLHPNSPGINGSSHQQQAMNNLSGMSSSMSNSTPKPPMQGILKDPNRKLLNNMQILNVQTGINSSTLLGPGVYDPTNPHNLSSFNTSMGYTDADGHLV